VRVAWLVLVAGCGATAFSPHFPDNDRADLRAVLARMGAAGGAPVFAAGPVNAAKRPLVLAASRGPDGRLVAYDLAAKKALWTQPSDVRSRVVLAGDLAFHREGKSALVARSLRSGAVRWRAPLPTSGRLLGVASDGRHLVYVTEAEGSRVEGHEVASLTALDAASGAAKWRLGAQGRMGAPALTGGLVLVPFSHQYLCVLDARTGRELGRLRNREEEIEFVVPTPEGVFYGSRGLFRLDTKAVQGVAARATYLRVPLPAEFLRAAYATDAYSAAQSQYTAYDRNRLLWRVTSDGAGFRDQLVFLHNYRFVFAMSATTGSARWAYAYPGEDLVASAHLGQDLLLVSAKGDIVALDALTGAAVGTHTLGMPVVGATIDADGFAAPRGPTAAADLTETLTEIIWDPDRRFEQVKLFCIAELSRIADPRVVGALIRIVTHENVDRTVYARAAETLIARVDSASTPELQSALMVRTDYLAATRARGVDALAGAAAKLRARDLAPPLIEHLLDAETPVTALASIVAALVAIGEASAVEPLAQFLLDHRADEAMEEHPEALRAAADGLMRLGGPTHRQLLAFIEGDGHTRPFLRAYVGDALRAKGPAKTATAH